LTLLRGVRRIELLGGCECHRPVDHYIFLLHQIIWFMRSYG
jgi:hypothetical protein